MTNPNDITATIYDIVSRPQKGPEVTRLEIDLIKKLVPIGSKILDVGCGTGRHAIQLALAGFEVTGIDSSVEMIKVAKAKALSCQLTTISFKRVDVLHYSLAPNTYNLAIFFWNSFNEICLTKSDAKNLLLKLSAALKPGGKILLNMDKPEWIEKLTSFSTSYEYKNLTYNLEWSIKEHNEKSNVTTSEEKVEVMDDSGKVVAKTLSHIKQRWWGEKELNDLATQAHLNITKATIKNIDENYYILHAANNNRLPYR